MAPLQHDEKKDQDSPASATARGRGSPEQNTSDPWRSAARPRRRRRPAQGEDGRGHEAYDSSSPSPPAFTTVPTGSPRQALRMLPGSRALNTITAGGHGQCAGTEALLLGAGCSPLPPGCPRVAPAATPGRPAPALLSPGIIIPRQGAGPRARTTPPVGTPRILTTPPGPTPGDTHPRLLPNQPAASPGMSFSLHSVTAVSSITPSCCKATSRKLRRLYRRASGFFVGSQSYTPSTCGRHQHQPCSGGSSTDVATPPPPVGRCARPMRADAHAAPASPQAWGRGNLQQPPAGARPAASRPATGTLPARPGRRAAGAPWWPSA